MIRPGFVYGLEPLLRKRHSELDVARGELAAARKQVEQRSQQLRDGLTHLRELEQRCRDLAAPGSSIDLDTAQRLQQCLAAGFAETEQRRREFDRARVNETQTMENWRAARQAVQRIERHRESAAAAHKAEQAHDAQLLVDEMYLLGLQSSVSGTTTTRAWGASAAPAGTDIGARGEIDT